MNDCRADSYAQSIYTPVYVHAQSVEVDDVSTVLQSHNEWEDRARMQAVASLHHCITYLRDEQLKDGTLSRVLYHVERRQRPSRREQVQEVVAVMRCLKHWKKLVVSNGILYRVLRDQSTRSKRHQYVVPESLKAAILSCFHDDAHQGQVFLALS